MEHMCLYMNLIEIEYQSPILICSVFAESTKAQISKRMIIQFSLRIKSS